MNVATAEDVEDKEKPLIQSDVDLLQEILDTEDAYVDKLRIIAEEYMPLFETTDPEKVKVMKKFKSLIFGAIEDVYIYHTNIIYPDLIAINKRGEPPSLEKFAEVIAFRKDAFDPYAFYVQGRPASKMLLAYNLGQHKSLKLIDEALTDGNKTRGDLELILQEPINRVKLYAKLLAKMISKTLLDDPNIDILSDAFGAVDLEDEYETAVTAWAAERIKECPIDLRDQGDLYKHVTIHFSEGDGNMQYACIFLFDRGLVITTPELYDLPPEQHFKELTFLHYIPLTGCEVRTGSGAEDRFDIKVTRPEGGEKFFTFWAGSRKNRTKLLKILANSSNAALIKFSPGAAEKAVSRAVEKPESFPGQKPSVAAESKLKVEAEAEAKGELQQPPVENQAENKGITNVLQTAEEFKNAEEEAPEEVQSPYGEVETAKPSKTNLLAFWRTKEEEAKLLKKKSEAAKSSMVFKYGKEVGEEERKARAFKLKESSRFKFWKLKEQEMKKIQKEKKHAMKSEKKGKRTESEPKWKSTAKK